MVVIADTIMIFKALSSPRNDKTFSLMKDKEKCQFVVPTYFLEVLDDNWERIENNSLYTIDYMQDK